MNSPFSVPCLAVDLRICGYECVSGGLRAFELPAFIRGASSINRLFLPRLVVWFTLVGPVATAAGIGTICLLDCGALTTAIVRPLGCGGSSVASLSNCYAGFADGTLCCRRARRGAGAECVIGGHHPCFVTCWLFCCAIKRKTTTTTFGAQRQNSNDCYCSAILDGEWSENYTNFWNSR